jgi:probable rRNA maturation factor
LTADRLLVVVQYAAKIPDTPAEDFFETCARHALPGVQGEVVIRIVDEAESAMLNERYRGKQGPTNVLAFPAGPVPAAAGEMTATDDEPLPLGDIAICAPVVTREARQQGKQPEAHWAHIVIHGCLHLCGFDHQAEAEASQMESREASVLAELGIADPYRNEC